VDELRSTHTPLTVGCLMLPWRALSNISEVLWQLLISRTGVYIAIVFVILKILNYERTFVAVLALLGRAYGIVDRSIVFCANKSVGIVFNIELKLFVSGHHDSICVCIWWMDLFVSTK
jgi:hypothetical protein